MNILERCCWWLISQTVHLCLIRIYILTEGESWRLLLKICGIKHLNGAWIHTWVASNSRNKSLQVREQIKPALFLFSDGPSRNSLSTCVTEIHSCLLTLNHLQQKKKKKKDSSGIHLNFYQHISERLYKADLWRSFCLCFPLISWFSGLTRQARGGFLSLLIGRGSPILAALPFIHPALLFTPFKITHCHHWKTALPGRD